MSTATVTSRGRITVPAKVRDALRIKAGDRIEFMQIEPGRFELLTITQSVTVLKELIRKPTAPVTIATMMEEARNIPIIPTVSCNNFYI